MKLTLTVTASQPGNAPQGTSRSVQGDQVRIGRGAGCDWILPDPLNHLSKLHCVVAPSAAGFVVTDTSTNGVFINHGGEAVGNGRSVALRDGDRLTLGDYVLEARIAEDTADAPRAIAVGEDDDPFGIGDLIANRVQPPLASAPIPEPNAPSFAPFVSEPGDFSRSPIIPEDIAWLDDGIASQPKAPIPTPFPADSGLATSDHVAGHQAAYVPPRVEGSGIPDDWWNDGDEPIQAATSAAPRRAAPAAVPVAPIGDLIAAFLEGAELTSDALKGQDAAAVMRAVGRAYRAAVLGLAEVLRTRALIKSEFRIEQTRIAAIGNNPMKFLENPDEILAAMVGAAAPGFQEAGMALRDGIRDLKAHQLAMIAAIQVALTQLLTQFDPEILKSRLEKRSLLSAVLPGARKARYWEVFEESYKSIAAELEDDFNGVFGKAFAEAYEDELRRP